MKILNFNIERLKTKSKAKTIIEKIESFNADIIVLTETNSKLIEFERKYFSEHSLYLSKNHDGVKSYNDGESRISIYSKFPIKNIINTTDKFTSLSVEIETNLGNLIIYGTIIGVFGYGRNKERFIRDFEQQKLDFERIFKDNNVCLVGDLNISLSGWIYPSKDYREQLHKIINQFDLDNSTGKLEDNIDHILISKKFIGNYNIEVEKFNVDKKLSDHIGICLTIKK